MKEYSYKSEFNDNLTIGPPDEAINNEIETCRLIILACSFAVDVISRCSCIYLSYIHPVRFHETFRINIVILMTDIEFTAV